ncbi:uncharacterized protein LOC34617590 [Cyclospora cayetanensis]|uniref:Uncharacterized protein LOC34617590 n=1 Tax=Cyclospora cayetanensis TaxID=88456 RepID=A0A6P6RVA4_9EIME|nr:uncharacterized protein LOC34617590 [Cyclospora cayetanensis]
MADSGDVTKFEEEDARGPLPNEVTRSPSDSERRKKHMKKNTQPHSMGSPSGESDKERSRGTHKRADGDNGASESIAEEEPQNKPAKIKKKKKKSAVVIEDRDVCREEPRTSAGATEAPKPRKSTLLLCDNAAAVALGNLVAIQALICAILRFLQQGLISSVEGKDEADGIEWVEEMDDEETEKIIAKLDASERRIAELRNDLFASTTKPLEIYFEELEHLTQGDALIIGVANENDVLAIEQKEAHVKIAACVARQKELQEQQQRLLLHEQVIRKRILEEIERKEAKLRVLQRQAEKQDLARQNHLVKLVRECECRMEARMARREARLSAVYGLLKKDGEYSADMTQPEKAAMSKNHNFVPLGKLYRVEWLRAPQPVKMSIDFCRGLKDKVPPGRYIMSVSIWTRIGGTRLRWSGLQSVGQKMLQEVLEKRKDTASFSTFSESTADEQEVICAGGTSGVTTPIEFGGTFKDECLRLDDTIVLVCPSEIDVQPGMCFVFELFLLRGQHSPVDKVVGWGAFPLVDSDFRIIEGSYKVLILFVMFPPAWSQLPAYVPLLRGPVDPSIRRYIDIEHTIGTSLDCWLCHLYFRCQLLPKYSKGHIEFELQLEHAAALIGGRKNDTHGNKAQQHRQFWGASLERAKADDLLQQLVCALQACEEMKSARADPAPIVSKDGVRAWRHRESTETLESIADLNAVPNYRYSVYCGMTLSHPSEASRKLKYLKSSLLDDFRPSLDTRENCTLAGALLCVVLAIWCCSLVFGSGTWLFLRAIQVPVYEIELSAFYVRLEFVQDVLALSQVIGTSVAGPLACFIVFVLASAVLHVANVTLGRQPYPVYQFLSALGAATALSPILMLTIEAIKGEWRGTSFMLFSYYKRDVNSGTFGVIIKLVIDLVCMGLSTLVRNSCAFYGYAIWIHRQGQVSDTHRRLTGDDSLFHLPLDVEVSERYLMRCCENASQYIGSGGEIRSLRITHYPVTEVQEALNVTTTEWKYLSEGKKQHDADLITELAIYTVNSKAGTQALLLPLQPVSRVRRPCKEAFMGIDTPRPILDSGCSGDRLKVMNLNDTSKQLFPALFGYRWREQNFKPPIEAARERYTPYGSQSHNRHQFAKDSTLT